MVVKSAVYANGVLTIELAREVPEALRPRRIEISVGAAAGKSPGLIEHEKAERRVA